MATVFVTVKNSTGHDFRVHVYDLFGGGRVEVQGSPCALAAGDMSPTFELVVTAAGTAKMAYSCEGGPSLSDIDVASGDVIEID